MGPRSASLLSILGIALNPLALAKDVVNAVFTIASELFGAAASAVVTALLGFVTTTSEPVFSSGWWTGPGQALFDRVLVVAGSLLALAFMLAMVTAVLSGDHGVLVRAARRLPLAVIETTLLVAVTGALIAASDEVATFVTHGATRGLSTFAATDLTVAITSSGLVGLVAGGLVVLAGLVVWLELICRSALIYVAVMTGPLIFAASVHPSVQGLKRRYVEMGLALILSKVLVALAFATGAAMLGGLGRSPSFSAAIGALMEALAILLVACFAPFILLRLLVGAEAIVVAEGLERRPGRAALQLAGTASTASGMASMLRGLRGGSLGDSGLSSGGPGTGATGGGPPGGGGPGGSPRPPAPPGGRPSPPGAGGGSSPPPPAARGAAAPAAGSRRAPGSAATSSAPSGTASTGSGPFRSAQPSATGGPGAARSQPVPHAPVAPVSSRRVPSVPSATSVPPTPTTKRSRP